MREDKLALGVVLRQSRTVDVVRAMRGAGMDWLFIDMEHNSMSIDMAAQLSVTALDVGIAPVVRVPTMDLTLATRALDNGALGIILPHVETADEARAIASALRYPPFGRRSLSSALPYYDFKLPPLVQATREMDAATVVMLNIETEKGIANIEEIAAVPGIDVLLIGATDLSFEMNLHGQFEHPRVVDAFQRTIAAAQRHGKFVGMGGIADPAVCGRFIDMGVRLIVTGSDTLFMITAATQRAEVLRKLHP